MKILSALETHIGRRSNNEDSACSEPAIGLYAVADGMGGYEGGEVAAEIAIDSLRGFVRNNKSDRDCTWPYKLSMEHSLEENLMLTAARIAHEQIEVRRVGELAEMGSTIVAMLVHGNQAVLVHVGDSRIYRLRSGTLEQLTRDHSLYEELRETTPNLPSREDYPYGNVITRALGLRGQADASTVTIDAGDVYILCSDGLSDVVSDESILEVAKNTSDVNELSRTLVSMAYDGGGRDNITVLALRCEQSSISAARAF